MGFATKNLSETDRKNIARDLFKVTSTEDSKGELHGLCPIHNESNPSFSYNFRKDFYNCFSCGASGDLLKLWSEVNGYGQKEGFKAFCEKFGLSSGGDQKTGRAAAKGGGGEGDDLVSHEKAVEQMHRAWEMFPSLPDAWIERLEKTRGWSRRWIEILDLRLETYRMTKKGDLIKVRTPEKIAIPVRDIAGQLVNIRLYHEGAKQYKIISFARSTGSSRLFPAWPLKGYVEEKICEYFRPVILCEGESDTICALSHGLNAITQTSKLKTWPEDHKKAFKDRDVVIAYDADQPGQKYARFAAQALTGVAKSIRMIQWPSFMGIDESGAYPDDHGQDVTDFFVRHKKTAEDFKALIEAAPVYDAGPSINYAPESPDDPGPLEFFARGVNDRLSFKPRLLANKILSDLSLLSDPETGLMYRWNNHYWEEFDEDHVRGLCLKYLGDESQKSRAEDAAYQVKMLCTMPHGRKTNDQIDWICLQNGMFNYKTYEIRPHEPDYFCTYSLPVTFNPDSDKRCDRWLRYLEETVQTQEVIAQLQEFAGYILVRHTKFEKCLLLIGPGADGKSKYLNIMKEIVGDQNCAAVSFPDLEDQFQRSSLYNKLLNISTEIGAKAIESPYFKAITSGDPINAAFKHKNTFTFSPYCKLAFAANRLPRVLDNSDGYFRRILPVRFKRQFFEWDPDTDVNLLDALKGELSEIFSWAVVGLVRLTENKKFTESAETKSMMMDYRRINNPVLCYVQDQCEIGDEYEIDKKDLYEDYKGYCGRNGYTSLSRENFFRELQVAVNNLRQYQPRDNGIRKRVIVGIKVKVYAD